MAYLVDTNIMVDFTRGNVKAADYLDSLADACLLSAITALELIGGARSQREVTDLDIMISAYDQIPPTDDITRRAYYLMKVLALNVIFRGADPGPDLKEVKNIDTIWLCSQFSLGISRGRFPTCHGFQSVWLCLAFYGCGGFMITPALP
jgi:predicted nucleic acid-binding protein